MEEEIPSLAVFNTTSGEQGNFYPVMIIFVRKGIGLDMTDFFEKIKAKQIQKEKS